MTRVLIPGLFLVSFFTLALAVGRPAAAAEIPIVEVHESDNPLVAIRVLFRSGSVDDPAGQEGITALLANLMVEGGTERLSSAELLEALFPMAAELSVQCDKETTVFMGRVHKDHLNEYLPIFVDVLLSPRWDPREFARLRDVQVSAVENELRSNNDEEFGKETLEWMLYSGHPYGHPVDGTVAGLKSLDLATVREHSAKVFTRSRAVLGLAGGYSEDVREILRKTLDQLPEGTPLAAIPEAKASGPKVVIVEKDAPATAISMGFPFGLRRTDPDYPAMWLGTSAFGEHRQSGGRLFQALREKRGLNYGDYAYSEVFRQAGFGTHPRVNIGRSRHFFSIWIRPVEHQNRVFAMRCALWQLDLLLKKGLTEDEVSQTKGFLDGYTRLWELTTSRRLGFALDDRFNGTRDYLKTSREKFPSISASQVNATMKKWIDPSELRFAIITSDAAAMRDALVSGTPSPIEYPTPKPPEILEQDKTFIAMPLQLKAEDVVVVQAGDMFEK